MPERRRSGIRPFVVRHNLTLRQLIRPELLARAALFAGEQCAVEPQSIRRGRVDERR